MSDLQSRYEAMIERLTPLMPEKGMPPVEYAAASQAFLTCAVNVFMNCYHVDEANGRQIVKKAWNFIGNECEQLSK